MFRRCAMVEGTSGLPPPTVGTTTFPIQVVESSLSLLLSPVDGTLLSAAVLPHTCPLAGAEDARGNSLLVGRYSGASLTVGATTLNSPGPPPANQALFVAAFDGDSRPEGAQRLGASGDTRAIAIAVAHSGRGFVAS
jgi:hypothetical protein